MSVIDFYDELAPEYHLIYEDWNIAIDHQGVAIDRLIRSRLPDAQSVLDCSCGIGTQALGLASRGYKVLGTDVSERALDRARGWKPFTAVWTLLSWLATFANWRHCRAHTTS